MTLAAAQASLTSPQREALLEALRLRTGLKLQPHQMADVDGIVRDACERFVYRDVEELLHALKADAGVTPQLEYLVGRVTIGESYFFRDDEQLRFLREHWLPALIESRRDSPLPSIRIWSAGCSAGQEIYSLAMLLLDTLPDPDSWTLHLLGTDINADSLALAVRGCYSEWSLRATPQAVRERHFARDGDRYCLRPQVRDLVKFAYLNLHEDRFPTMLSGTGAMDLILCRNVFIYFDPQLVPAVMDKFQASLVPDGCLILGAADLSAQERPGLELVNRGNVFYYRRPPEMPAVVPAPPPPPRPTRARYPDVVELLREQRWESVVQKVDEYAVRNGEDAELAQHRAKALANLGRFDAAANASGTSLEMAPLDKHTYLIRALIMLELNDLERAAECLRKAIYLDSGFVEAHFQLGLLQLRMGDRKAGLRSLSNALELAEHIDPGRPVHNAPGLLFGRLAELLRSELAVHREEGGR
ncbi:MAG: hypothetical protein PHQ14_08595 [Chromatiales bacterium]|jgi:chemotaxis protein methyltransferase CheR|nr:hypothetical protein [Chromatiales bacterium]MDX9766120.1 CheR family methyltransferase [Ectothiorhodospiraceae bacterium]